MSWGLKWWHHRRQNSPEWFHTTGRCFSKSFRQLDFFLLFLKFFSWKKCFSVSASIRKFRYRLSIKIRIFYFIIFPEFGSDIPWRNSGNSGHFYRFPNSGRSPARSLHRQVVTAELFNEEYDVPVLLIRQPMKRAIYTLFKGCLQALVYRS